MGIATTLNTSLERRTIEAHRSYLAILVAVERARHRAICPACAARSNDAGNEVLEAEEWHVETYRTRFRDLLDELGYMPSDLAASLPDIDETTCAS